MRDMLSLQYPISKEIAKAKAILFHLLIIPRETEQDPVHERRTLPQDHEQDAKI
jgi:hypothetical protein